MYAMVEFGGFRWKTLPAYGQISRAELARETKRARITELAQELDKALEGQVINKPQEQKRA
jgi:hypothetical protein